MAICDTGSVVASVGGLSAMVSEAMARIASPSSGMSGIGVRAGAEGKNAFFALSCVALLYQFRTAFLFSNHAKITSLPLVGRALSTPRQPGVALRAPTRSGKPPG